MQQVRGNVTVRFSNGDPVGGARVALAIRHSTGDPAADAAIAALPGPARELLLSGGSTLGATTGPDGRAPFAMPFTLGSPDPNQLLRLNHPGRYPATATGGARGSAFAAAEGAFVVLAALPPGGP